MKRTTFLFAVIAAWLTVAIAAPLSASAQLVNWTGADGLFQDAGNWSGSVPGENALVVFSEVFAQSDVITVTFADDVVNEELVHEGLELTFDLSGHTYTITNAVNIIGGDLTLVDGTFSASTFAIDTGLVTVSDSAVFSSSNAIFGTTAGSDAQINVFGVIDSDGSITLGNLGAGELNIGHDGTGSTGSGGDVTTGSLLLGASSGGAGTINLGDGATLESASAILGASDGGTGTVNVGDGAVWTNTDAITVGAISGSGSAAGTLTVEDGGLLHTRNLSIGGNGGASHDGTGAIVVASTDINLDDLPQSVRNQIDSGGLFVASDGLSIVNGGVLEADQAILDAFTSATTASATVTGNGSLLDLDGGEMTVGGSQSGGLTIADGGRVESGDATVGDNDGSAGSVTVTGHDGNDNASQWNVDGVLGVGNEGSGSAAVTGGGRISTTGDTLIGSNASGSGSMTVTGTAANGDASTLDVGGNLGIGFATGSSGAVAESDINATLTVSDGGLVIVNNGAGALTINGSGLLAGNATIDGNVQLFGRMYPRTPTGSIAITGDFESHGGSVLQIQYSSDPLDVASVFPDLDPALVDNPLTSGYLTVDGQTTLADGTIVEITKADGGAIPDDAIIIIESKSGGMDPASPPELEAQGTFLLNWESDVLDSNGVNYLLLTAVLDEPGLTDFLDSLTGNEKSVADALADGELFEVFTQLNPNNPTDDLRTLLPLQHASVATRNIQTAVHFHNAFLQEMAGLRISERVTSAAGERLPRLFGSTAGQRAGAGGRGRPTERTPFEDAAGTWGGFLGGTGAWDSIKSGNDRLEHTARVMGVQGGVHRHLSQEWLIGAAAGYQRTNLTFARGFGEGDTDTFRVGPYLSWMPGGGPFAVDAAATYGHHRNNVERETMFGAADSRYNAQDFSMLGQASYEFALAERTAITPILATEYTRLRTDSFREDDGGLANLNVDSMTNDSLRVRLGGSVAHAFDVDQTTVVPEVYAGWARELLDPDVDVNAQFAAGSPTFTTSMAGVGEDALQTTAGLTAMKGTQFTLFIRYEGEFQSGRTSHGVVGGIDIRF